MSSSFKEAAAAKKNVEIGKQLKDQGSLQEAIAKYKMALKLTPDNIQALTQLSSVYEAQKNWEEVIKCCRKIVALQPNNSRAYIRQARALKQQNKIYGAIAAFQEAIEMDKNVLRAQDYKELGDLLVQLKSSENQQAQANDAIAAYQKAIELKPDFSHRVYISLADTLQKQERFEEAIASYQKALQVKPDLGAGVYAKLGNAQLKQGQLDQAITTYRKAIELDPDSVAANQNMGNALQQKSLFNDAMNCYQKAIELNPNAPGLYRLIGDTLTKQGKTHEASQYYQRAASM
ncbi:MAG: tetratricopeptide repeat protein [Okeania sp. SIO2C9]|uniref:tetratricopeptide repeat protein n=1 Tax=Okeania sp. SIO2C9 TaxID=2607791 RepID=UPI0013C15A30|nr:tetratricopeptide repeat protein [Okeania sp. SIO2C9]NEQ76624.1 tetratricopeptide repeat protein [Okeania sp. SIO2C9]